MAENVKPLEIDAYKGKVKNRIQYVGVELEGGWVELPPGVEQLVDDGSVFQRRMPAGVKYIGELPIGPVFPSGIEALMRKSYPPKVNHTCGMHVHMSFANLYYYQLLMVPEYQKTVVHYLTKWAEAAGFKPDHHIWGRLRGESVYCQDKFWPDAQVSNKRKQHDQQAHGHRYTHVHYCGRINTIEIRTLPMMERFRTAVSAVHEVFDITNACLHVMGANSRRQKVVGRIELPNNFFYEETVIEQV